MRAPTQASGVVLLERNMLADEGAQVLANSARTHPALALVRLDENFICDVGAKALTKLVSKSPSLTSLGVCWNAIEKNQVGCRHVHAGGGRPPHRCKHCDHCRCLR